MALIVDNTKIAVHVAEQQYMLICIDIRQLGSARYSHTWNIRKIAVHTDSLVFIAYIIYQLYRIYTTLLALDMLHANMRVRLQHRSVKYKLRLRCLMRTTIHYSQCRYKL